jgi:STE24 endopeptidase
VTRLVEQPEKDETDSKEIKRYNRIKILLSVVSIITGVGFLVVVLLTRFSSVLEKWVLGMTSYPYLAFLLFCLVLGGMEVVITLPLSFYGGFIVEHRFGLSRQSLGRWCWEEVKGLLVGIVLFTPLLVVFYFFLRRFPVIWWVPVGFVYFLFTVLLVQLGPVLIFPLFYKFTPVEDASLKKRLRCISEKVDLKVSGIFSFNLSKNTKKANAAFAGLGRTRRIILSDTLLRNFSVEEIESVAGHELGHYRYGHLWKGILFGLVLTFGGLFAANALFRLTMGTFGGVQGYELSVLPLLGLYLMGFGLVTSPIQNGVSRRFERQADGFSVEMSGDREAFIMALDKLGRMNKADREPHPLVEFFFYSHPSLKKRTEAIRAMGGGEK